MSKRSIKFIILMMVFSIIPAFQTGYETTALAGDSDSSEEWVSIFNGKDLAGWDGDPRLWSVKDGVIRGQTTVANPARGNTFLIWRDGKLRDFESDAENVIFRTLSKEPLLDQPWQGNGTLRVNAGGKAFTSTVTRDGKATFQEK